MKDQKVNKTTIQWIVSILFILGGIGSIGKGIYFIFFLLFGLLINPKFPQMYFKLFKKNLGSVQRVIACVLVFLLAGITSPKSNNNNDTTQTANIENTSAVTTIEETTASEVTTEDTTIITTTKETELTTTILEEINPLVDSLTEDDVKSGGGNIIGKCAYTKIKKSEFSKLTTKDFLEFCNQCVKDSGYNWVSIIFEDDTGITFINSEIDNVQYCKVDNQGSNEETIGDVIIDKDSVSLPSKISLSDSNIITTTEEVTTVEETTITTEEITTTKATVTTRQIDNNITYIINTDSGKFHKSSCGSAKQISDENYLEFTGSRDEVISQGYDPCERCKP